MGQRFLRDRGLVGHSRSHPGSAEDACDRGPTTCPRRCRLVRAGHRHLAPARGSGHGDRRLHRAVPGSSASTGDGRCGTAVELPDRSAGPAQSHGQLRRRDHLRHNSGRTARRRPRSRDSPRIAGDRSAHRAHISNRRAGTIALGALRRGDVVSGCRPPGRISAHRPPGRPIPGRTAAKRRTGRTGRGPGTRLAGGVGGLLHRGPPPARLFARCGGRLPVPALAASSRSGTSR